MFKDEYGRKILCDTGCCFSEDAKYCKYCKSGECEAANPKKENTLIRNALINGDYVSYGGVLHMRNSKRGL